MSQPGGSGADIPEMSPLAYRLRLGGQEYRPRNDIYLVILIGFIDYSEFFFTPQGARQPISWNQ
jgi:hypothetical protein